MSNRNITSWMCLMGFLGIVSDSPASSWTCQYSDLTRQVTAFYPDAPARLPCKVYYSKPDENALPRALWKAENQEGFCARKAEAFVDKLRSLGWQCSRDAL
jgi:hypothetical protein